MARNVLSDLWDLTSKKGRGVDSNSGVMSLAEWVGCVSAKWGQTAQGNADFCKG